MASKGKEKVTSVSSKMKSKKLKSKKTKDTASNKEFYNLVLPASLESQQAGVTLIKRSHGTYFAPDALKGRTFEVNQADLTAGANAQGYRKFKFMVDGVKGRDAMSSFHSMELISDKVKSIPKKWHTLMNAEMKIDIADGHTLRVFTIANTKRNKKSVKKNCHASLAQLRAMRKIVFNIIEEELKGCTIDEVMKKLMSETIGTRMENETYKIYPMQSCYVRKVKVLKKPKVDESEFETKNKSKRVEIVQE